MTISTINTRQRGTQGDGRAFSQEQLDVVWAKAKESMKNHPLIMAACKTFSKGFKDGTHVLDDYGHVISKKDYGIKEKHGWEIDHIHPVENKHSYPKGASFIDNMENLRVLHWESNERKGKNDARVYELEYEHVILNKSA